MQSRVAFHVHVACISMLAAVYVALRWLGPGTPGYSAFDLDGEGNIPTWFSAAGLAACAFLMLLLLKQASALWIFALLLAIAAIDEVAMLHERAAAWLLAHRGGAPPFAIWVFGGALAAALGVSCLPTLLRLPKLPRARLILSGALFVVSAVGVESLGQAYARRHGWHDAIYTLLVLIEECGEMLGAALCMRALLAWRETNGSAVAERRTSNYRG
jgi:hypothetical protein